MARYIFGNRVEQLEATARAGYRPLEWLERDADLRRVVTSIRQGAFSQGDYGLFDDSSGLGALIGIFKLVAERGGVMNLARPQPNVKMVLEITCTNRSLRVFGSVEEALHATGG